MVIYSSPVGTLLDKSKLKVVEQIEQFVQDIELIDNNQTYRYFDYVCLMAKEVLHTFEGGCHAEAVDSALSFLHLQNVRLDEAS